jgi:integrase
MLQVAEGMDWRFKLALILAHETGHRISALCKLKWNDIDFQAGEITWTREKDKVRNEHQVQASEVALAALGEALVNASSVGECWVFPSPRDATKCCSRHLMRDWWYRAERRAGLEHIDRLCWHGLRRKFATDFKHHPPADVSQLGGWKRAETVLRLYQKPDPTTQREMLDDRRSVRVREA